MSSYRIEISTSPRFSYSCILDPDAFAKEPVGEDRRLARISWKLRPTRCRFHDKLGRVQAADAPQVSSDGSVAM